MVNLKGSPSGPAPAQLSEPACGRRGREGIFAMPRRRCPAQKKGSQNRQQERRWGRRRSWLECAWALQRTLVTACLPIPGSPGRGVRTALATREWDVGSWLGWPELGPTLRMGAQALISRLQLHPDSGGYLESHVLAKGRLQGRPALQAVLRPPTPEPTKSSPTVSKATHQA